MAAALGDVEGDGVFQQPQPDVEAGLGGHRLDHFAGLSDVGGVRQHQFHPHRQADAGVAQQCPRPRHVIKPVMTARAAAGTLREAGQRGLRCGILFGPERAGLDNDDMAQADTLVRYPINPAFDSLNLAQAVMVMAYEWWTAADETPGQRLMTNETTVAPKGQIESLLAHLIDELDASGFLRNAPKRPGMVRNLYHLFQRGEVTEQELRTLHGVISMLALGRRQRGRLEPDGPNPDL